jgi:hypothetical protein
VPQQFFATSMVLTPLLRGLFGLEVDAPAGTLSVAPWIPPGSEQLQVRNLSVGGARLSLTVTDAGDGKLMLVVAADANAPAKTPLKIRFAPPGLGSAEGVLSPGKSSLELQVAAPRTWAVYVASTPAVIGERSTAARIVAERTSGSEYRVTIEAPAGANVPLLVQAPAGAHVRGDEGGGAVVGMTSEFKSLDTAFKRFASHATVLEVRMPRDGADADGYVRREVVLK